jgi:hypothetical protein
MSPSQTALAATCLAALVASVEAQSTPALAKSSVVVCTIARYLSAPDPRSSLHPTHHPIIKSDLTLCTRAALGFVSSLLLFAVTGVIFTWCFFTPCDWACHNDLEEGIWDWRVTEKKKQRVVEKIKKKQPRIKHIVYESTSDEEELAALRVEHHEVDDDEELVVLKKGSSEVVTEDRAIDKDLYNSIAETVHSAAPHLEVQSGGAP